MARIIIGPSKYVQDRGALNNICNYTKNLGKNIMFISSSNGIGRVRSGIEKSFESSDISVSFEVFGGECSKKEIERLRQCVKDRKADVIGAVGGGKTCDTARAVAYYENIPVIIVPTIASTDAPCSGLSVIYTDDGVFSEVLLNRNPDLVIVDTDIIVKAPVRLLVSGKQVFFNIALVSERLVVLNLPILLDVLNELAEDNKINFFVANKFLESWGVKVTHVENGALALEEIKKQDFDLILMDLHMPVMDGIEATRIIRSSADKKISQIPIVALTAAVMSEAHDKIEDLAINDYVLKPFKPKDLYNRIVKNAR